MEEFVNPILAGYNWFLAFFYYLPFAVRACIYLSVLYFFLSSLINLFQHLR